ncbi:hypothetical protein ACHQM5_015216 [Ranunculus cassubicifolius]
MSTTGAEIAPNQTIYINNLDEKTKLDELKKSLYAVFAQFGKIVEVLAFKTLKHKGQAWVVFEDVASATNAIKNMNGFPLYDKEIKIQFAKTKSDVIAKADGTFVPREKRKRHEERAEKKRREQPNAHQSGHGQTPYPGAYGVPNLPFLGAAKNLPDAPALPNNILFVQNLPHETTPMMLQMLFCQYDGFKEVRMVEAKPGIAFVEYGNENESTIAMHGLQNFKITQQNPMVITYAKK